MDYTVHVILQARILEWVAFPFSRGFPNPGIESRFPAWCWIYQLNHKGSPRILEWVAYPFSSGSSQPRNQTGVSCIAGGFFINWAIREVLGKYQREDMLGIWQNVVKRPISGSSQTPAIGRKSTAEYFWKDGIGVLGRGGSHCVNLEAYSRQWIWTSQWWCWVGDEVVLLTVPWHLWTQHWRLLERKELKSR